ncbi:dihydrolipoamide acetyltransferase family protein [Candidatus Borrarchaeum sp.]|uniref:dihydrolipoamide acetyltransferase family protein n=1 Tax=Candidatus Borrarchaeum sp. TaxID=2846742 RepID=UPI00257F0541|nr:dihydrolipoamide acetyltransferase family protein [Candidatus Borrarchaeum sp.]
MVTKVVITKMSMVMEEATIVEWLKNEGDTVEKGEPIVEILTEKETVELEAPASGVLLKILAEEAMELPIDAVIALIGDPNEPLPDLESLVTALPQEASVVEIESPTETPPSLKPEFAHQEAITSTDLVEEHTKRIIASPRAKKLATERGIDLNYITGTGLRGRIVERDVEAFLSLMVSEGPKIKEERKFFGIQKMTAKKVTESYQTIPQLTHVMEIDVTNIMNYRTKLAEEKGMKISYTAFLVKAVAESLVKHPILNSTLSGDIIKIYEDVNIGVAIATQDGLVVPVVHKASTKPIESISTEIKSLIKKAREKKLRSNDFMQRTFTVSNLGMYGIEFFTAIINPPEAAILSVGRMAEKPVVINGGIHIRSMMYLSLTYDHRIIDGAPAAAFLQTLRELLENPNEVAW